ncbi:MAG: DNA polymerase III subunit delta [Chloroflexota bacterium]|nr:DNA polymerase III subunit delta [Chloroflexota bacterium]
MIHLLHGSDGYRIRHALREIRAQADAGDGMLDANTTVLDGTSLTPGELLAHAQAVPFLASARLVIVEGLLAQIGGGRRGRRGKKATDGGPLAAWEAAAAQLADAATMPASTTLVFVEGELAKTNAAFPIFAPIAHAVQYDKLAKDELPGWIQRAADARGLRLAPRALAAIARLTAGDLWTAENELDKLAAYAAGDVVDEDVVSRVVSSAQVARVWDLGDAVVAGDERAALTSMRALLDEGQAAPLLMFMLVRQYRQIAIVKDMRDRRARQDEIARAAGIPGFRINAVSALASRYTWPLLREAYGALLDSDLAVKRGLRDDEASLQLLVHELCALAPGARPAGGYAPRAGAASG